MSYIDDIRNARILTIDEIVRISINHVPNRYRIEPWKYMDNQGRTLGRGTVVLETEEQCCAYMAAYGPMHKHKLMRALDERSFLILRYRMELKYMIGDVDKVLVLLL